MSVALAIAGSLSGCAWPTNDATTLKAIAGECQYLMRTVPPTVPHGGMPASTDNGGVAKNKWPRAIASLNPMWVTIFRDGCDIQIKPMFDGGWGYFIARTGGIPPKPEGRFTDLGYGVYWYHPY